jgi:plastocyanin
VHAVTFPPPAVLAVLVERALLVASAAVACLVLSGCAEPQTPGAELVNGCAPESFVRDEAPGPARIVFGDGYDYDPRCLRVTVGRTIRFEGPFAIHPLVAGRIEDGAPVDAGPVAGQPIPEVLSGLEVEFVAGRPGRFGFYCDLHLDQSMMGAIDVVDAVGSPDAGTRDAGIR